MDSRIDASTGLRIWTHRVRMSVLVVSLAIGVGLLFGRRFSLEAIAAYVAGFPVYDLFIWRMEGGRVRRALRVVIAGCAAMACAFVAVLLVMWWQSGQH